MNHPGGARWNIMALLFGLLGLACTSELTTEGLRSCSSLKPGDYIQVTDRDDHISRGVFCEMKKMDFLAYVDLTREMAAGAEEATPLPVPGERIMFTTVLEPQHVWHGTLIGFCGEYLWVRLNGDTEISHFYLTGVTRLVGWDGRMLFRDEIRTLMAGNKIPLLTVVALRTDRDMIEVPVSRIKHIEVITQEALAYRHP